MKRSLIPFLAVFALLAGAQTCTAAPAPRLSPAAQTLSQCVQTNHRLAVLILIDESGSLRTTDPLDQRVSGIRAVLTGLADLADTPVSGRTPEVSVLMAGFYGRVQPNPAEGSTPADAWQAVDGSTVDALNDEAGKYADLDTGKATDYVTALDASRQLLVERAAELTQEGGAPPCKALIWFTDGRYSMPTRVGKAGQGLPKEVDYAPRLDLSEPGAGLKAVAAGKAEMCRPSGLMDGIAREGIVRFTVALATELSIEDAAFLDAATTGSAGRQRCGVDLSEQTGEYLTAANGERLFFAFGNLLNPSTPLNEREVCPQLACLRGTTTFETVPGLSSFLIRASSGADSAYLELNGPDGKAVRLRPGDPIELTVSGADVVQRWVSDRAVEVEGTFPVDESAWIGRWSYVFVDPSAAASAGSRARSHNSLQLFSDLEPTVIGKPDVLRGVPTELKLGLASNAGSAQIRSGPLVGGASVTATVSDPVTGTTTTVPVAPSGGGEFTTTISVPNSSSASVLYLGLTANLATDSGTPIAPQYRSFSLPVRLPPGQGFPILRPAELHLASLEGKGSAEGTITVTGSQLGDGCVWVGEAEIEAPEQAGKIDQTALPKAGSAADCLSIGKGERRELTLRLTPSTEANGTVTAAFPVHLRSEIVDGDRVTSVPVTFVMVKPPDGTTRLVLLIALMLLGALLPLALLYLLNRLGARFTAPQSLLVLAQDAELSPAGIETATEPVFAAFEPVSSSGASREVTEMKIDLVRLRTVAARSLGDLFRGPYGIATAIEGGRVIAGGSSRRLREWKGGTEHEVPLLISGTWLFLPSDHRSDDQPAPADPWLSTPGPWEDGGSKAESPNHVSGRLILVISRSGDVGLGGELLSDASEALREAGIHETSENGGAPAEDEQRLRERIAEWLTRRGDRGGKEVAKPTPDKQSIDHDSTSSKVDPWA